MTINFAIDRTMNEAQVPKEHEVVNEVGFVQDKYTRDVHDVLSIGS